MSYGGVLNYYPFLTTCDCCQGEKCIHTYTQKIDNDQFDDYIANYITRGGEHSQWRTENESSAEREEHELIEANEITESADDEDGWELGECEYFEKYNQWYFPSDSALIKDLAIEFYVPGNIWDDEEIESAMNGVSVTMYINNDPKLTMLAFLVKMALVSGRSIRIEHDSVFLPIYISEMYNGGTLPNTEATPERYLTFYYRSPSMPKVRSVHFKQRFTTLKTVYPSPSNIVTPHLLCNFLCNETARFSRGGIVASPMLGFAIPWNENLSSLKRIVLRCYFDREEITKRFEDKDIYLMRDKKLKPMFYIFGLSSIFRSPKRFLKWIKPSIFHRFAINNKIDGLVEDVTVQHFVYGKDVGELQALNHYRFDYMSCTVETDGFCGERQPWETDGQIYAFQKNILIESGGLLHQRYCQ